MNGPDEHGRAGPAAEIATEAGGRSHSTERYGPTRLAATPTPIAQSRFFFDSCRFSCSSFVVWLGSRFCGIQAATREN